MENKTSTLKPIMNQFYAMTELVEAKNFIIDHISRSKINAESKRIILIKTAQQNDLISLQKYITNSMFKFEGKGL